MPEERVQRKAGATAGGEDTATLIAAYRSAFRYRKVAGLIVVIAILGVVLALAYRGFIYARTVKREITVQERYTALQKRFATSWSELRPKVEEQWKLTWPELRDLAKQKAEAARPELEQVAKTEVETLQKNLQSMIEAKVKAFVERIIEENKGSLQQDFPGITDPAKMEALVQMLVDATQSAAFRVFDPRFKEHYAVLDSIEIQRNKLPVEDATKSTTELLYRAGEVGWDLLLMKTGRPAETPVEAAAPQPAAKPAAAPAAPAPTTSAPAAPAPAPAPAAPTPAAR